MPSPNEPSDGGYVALIPHDDQYARVYCRRDNLAEYNQLGSRHWIPRSDDNESARSWDELCGMGRLAYVGEFVDRAVA